MEGFAGVSPQGARGGVAQNLYTHHAVYNARSSFIFLASPGTEPSMSAGNTSRSEHTPARASPGSIARRSQGHLGRQEDNREEYQHAPSASAETDA